MFAEIIIKMMIDKSLVGHIVAVHLVDVLGNVYCYYQKCIKDCFITWHGELYENGSLFLIVGIESVIYYENTYPCYILKPLQNDKYNKNIDKQLMWHFLFTSNKNDFSEYFKIID